jgi:ubiquitin carboxyl-terminal hydrolase 47
LLQKIQKREESDRILREKEMDMCKIKLYAHHPTQHQVVEAKLYLANDVTLQEATKMAYMVPLFRHFVFLTCLFRHGLNFDISHGIYLQYSNLA